MGKGNAVVTGEDRLDVLANGPGAIGVASTHPVGEPDPVADDGPDEPDDEAPKKGSRTKKVRDPELVAMSEIVDALDGLHGEAQGRVVEWVYRKYHWSSYADGAEPKPV